MKRFFTMPALCLVSSLALAQVPAPRAGGTAVAEEPRQLETVVVSGAYPAPRLVELTKGSKKLLIMPTLSPTPRAMVWDAPTVERRVAQANEVLGPPGVAVSADVGVFSGLMLYPAYRRSKENPEGKTLDEVLPTPTYARWRVAKDRYMPGNDRVERLRPVNAAQELFDAAVERAGLTTEDRIAPAIYRIAKANDIPIRSTTLQVVIKEPKETLKRLSKTSFSDVPCMQQTLDRIEADVQTMKARANAWAQGDVARLRELPYQDQKTACVEALANNDVARSQGIDDVEAAILRKWLEVARASLARHDVVLALVPMNRLEGPHGVLSAMTAEGYTLVGQD